MVLWHIGMEPRRRVKGYIKNDLSSGSYSTAGNAGPSMVFPFTQHQQAVYSSHATPRMYPAIGLPFGISVTDEQRRTNDGLISNQRLNDNWGFSVDNIRQLVNDAPLSNGLGALSNLNDADQSQTAVKSHWITGNRQARRLSENWCKVDEIVSYPEGSDSYNQSDFVIQYNDAKHFVIKSYSEDVIHKSIKHNEWASTPLGNQKLNEVLS